MVNFMKVPVVPENRMKVAVDIVIFTIQERALKVLLVKRGIAPFKDQLAIPGGFVLPDEDLDEAALRELREETGVSDVYLEQLYSFGDPKRDPRGRVISIAYFALISSDRKLKAGTDASEASWWPAHRTPKLAFDHAKILGYALDRLRNKLEYTTVGFQLLPSKFTFGELQSVYEAILEKKLDKRNFRRKIAELKILKPLTREYRSDVGRPAQLFQFVAARAKEQSARRD